MKWEVRTMRSGTSFFNATIYKKTVFRFWPLWAVILVFWGMLLPMDGLMAIQNAAAYGDTYGYHYVADFAGALGEYGTQPAVFFAVVFGLLAAMAVCSHLYSAKSANFMGALPIKREGLFLSHYAAGLTMLLAPNVAIFLLTLLVEVVGGAVEMVPLLFWLLSLSAMEFFFYSFALCIGMFAGHLLALPVYYGVFNVLAAAVVALVDQVMSEFYIGYYSSSLGTEVALCFTPVYMLSNVDIDRGSGLTVSDGQFLLDNYRLENIAWLVIYAVAAVVLAAIALLVYRRRHLETAGDVVAVKVMRPVFKYGVALCSGLFMGFLTTLVMGGGEVGLMIAIVIWGLVGYFVAQMFLDKSFKVFHKWKGAAAVTLVFVVMFLVVGFDLTGFETKVPDAGQVAEVRVRGISTHPYDSADYLNDTFTDPAIIEKVVAIHQAVVDNLDTDLAGGVYPDNGTYEDFRVAYTLKDGSVMTRDYDLILDLTECDTPGTVPYAMTQLLSDRDLVWQLYGFDEAAEDGTLRWVEWSSYPDITFYGPNAEKLLEAMKADFAAGSIGVRSLEGYEEESTLSFCWEYPSKYYSGIEVDGETAPSETWITIAVPDTAVNTLALLEELVADYTVVDVPTE